MNQKLSWVLGLVSLLTILLGLSGSWLVVLGRRSIPDDRLSTFLPWPVACTPRGCVTTREWREQIRVSDAFAASAAGEPQTQEAALTSVVRRHLVENAFVRSPVTAADARRYREEILHLKDEALLQESVGMTAAEYDQQIITPFLQQAALQQQRKAESISELYAGLSSERFVLVLPFHFRWDKDTGSVVRR